MTIRSNSKKYRERSNRPPAKPLAYYEAHHQTSKVAMVKAYATGDYTMNKIADYFDVHYSTVSRAVKNT